MFVLEMFAFIHGIQCYMSGVMIPFMKHPLIDACFAGSYIAMTPFWHEWTKSTHTHMCIQKHRH